MQIASFKYSGFGNLGDNFQTLAAKHCVPSINTFLERDELNRHAGSDRIAVVMNGWFSHRPENWPPANAIHPIFVGFHLTLDAMKAWSKHAGYFRRFQPIGCRDHGTRDFFSSLGIDAYTSYCPTLTFDQRDREPPVGRTAIVDSRSVYIPRSIRKNAITYSHDIHPELSNQLRLQLADEVLSTLRMQVDRVITTRLHCALPALAMGIPVVFFGDPTDYRISILKDLGLHIHDRQLFSKWRLGRLLATKVDWTPEPVDVSAFRDRLKADICGRVEALHTLCEG